MDDVPRPDPTEPAAPGEPSDASEPSDRPGPPEAAVPGATPPSMTNLPGLERHPDDLPPMADGRRGLPRGIVWAAALFVVVLVIASWIALSNDPAPAPTADPAVVRLGSTTTNRQTGPASGSATMTGQPAPNATYETWTGGRADLADLRGKPTVINFWSSTCTPCILEMPAFERVHQQLGDKVNFLGINVADISPEAARQMADRTGVTYPLGFDTSGQNGQMVTQFGGIGLPTTVIIGADGTIVYAGTGALDDGELRALLTERAPT